jgi:hypothetical protein
MPKVYRLKIEFARTLTRHKFNVNLKKKNCASTRFCHRLVAADATPEQRGQE